MITDVIATTGMIVWEAMIDQRDKSPGLDTLWGNRGSFDMRDYALDIAKWVELVYDVINEGDFNDGRVAFDFEFVPELVATLDWSTPGIFPKARVAAYNYIISRRHTLSGPHPSLELPDDGNPD
jgi:hypothetical protein